jgi:hypothetical protein
MGIQPWELFCWLAATPHLGGYSVTYAMDPKIRSVIEDE